MTQHSNIALQLISGEHGFTRSEQKIARVLLANYPAAGLSTVASLAGAAGVSAPTVIRFVKELGYDSFKDFQDELRQELSARETSTLQQVTKPAGTGASQGVGRGGSTHPESSEAQGAGSPHELAEIVDDTISKLPSKELKQAVALLSKQSRRIISCGGDYSQVAAEHLVLQLTQVRAHVSVLPHKPVLAAATICDSKKDDVLCVYDVRRYSKRSYTIASAAKAHGLKIVLFTDRWLSPIASIADAVIPVEVASSSGNDSTVAMLAATELICNETAQQLGAASAKRLSKLDELRLKIENPEG